MIDLCKLFGVEEGEEFKFGEKRSIKYRIYNGELNCTYINCENDWSKSHLELNEISGAKVIKIPKKKEFTDDELDIFKKIPKAFKWCTRDKNKHLYCYKSKPNKDNECWFNNRDSCGSLGVFDTLFQSIKWEDKEPVYIDDYVERGVE
jgi:hypothetical protein